MRPSPALILLAPALLVAQAATLDEGRLDPAWFGPEAAFQPSKTLGFQWLKPGLDLHNRTLQLRAWEPAAWLLGHRAQKDQWFLQRMESTLLPDMERSLRRGLKASLPLSLTAGDLLLSARAVDAVGAGDDYLAMGSVSLSFDVKIMDRDTGELLAAFHDTLQGPNPETVTTQYERWCENLGRLLAASVATPAAAKPPASTQPVFDLEGALRRIEGLKRDGLLSEEECQVLRKKATEKSAAKVP